MATGQNLLSHINTSGQLSCSLPGIPRGIEKGGSVGAAEGSGLFCVQGELHGSKVSDVLASPQALHPTFWDALLSGGFSGDN